MKKSIKIQRILWWIPYANYVIFIIYFYQLVSSIKVLYLKQITILTILSMTVLSVASKGENMLFDWMFQDPNKYMDFICTYIEGLTEGVILIFFAEILYKMYPAESQ